jgi:hypothetical protein
MLFPCVLVQRQLENVRVAANEWMWLFCKRHANRLIDRALMFSAVDVREMAYDAYGRARPRLPLQRSGAFSPTPRE